MKRFLFLALAAGLLTATSVRAADPVVEIDTSLGKIKVELNPDKAPITVKNFLAYVDDKFYDDTVFHRVMGKENTKDKEDFMIQGGGFSKDHKEKKTKEPAAIMAALKTNAKAKKRFDAYGLAPVYGERHISSGP